MDSHRARGARPPARPRQRPGNRPVRLRRRPPAVVSGTVFRDLDRDGTRDADGAGLAGRVVYVDTNNNGVRDITTAVFAGPDGRIFGFKSFTLEVPADALAQVTDVDVAVRVEASDLTLTLQRPITVAALYRGPFSTAVHRQFDDEGLTPPVSPLSAFDGGRAAGRWSLMASEGQWSGLTTGRVEEWSLALTVSEPYATTAADGSYTLDGLPPGAYRVRTEGGPDSFVTAPPAGEHAVTLAAGDTATGRDFGADLRRLRVTGRHVFYNHSAFDRRSAAADADDDYAIATDKTPLVPGAARSHANVTSYANGINGVMLDVHELLTEPTLADFSFKVPSSFDPSLWLDAPAPTGFAVRGLDVADPTMRRVTFTWPDRQLRNVWLQVSTVASAATRRLAPDVFYVGHLTGETGDAVTPDRVSASDLSRTRAAVSRNRVGVDSPFDHNRDGHVNVLDVELVRSNLGRSLPPAVLPAAVQSLVLPATSRTARPPHRAGWAASVLDGAPNVQDVT